MNPVGAGGITLAPGQNQRYRRRNPAREDRIAKCWVQHIQKTIQRHHDQGYFKRYAQQFLVDRNRTQGNRHQDCALDRLRPFPFVMDERQAQFEYPQWNIRLFGAIFSVDRHYFTPLLFLRLPLFS